jgi:hypothetical protein
MTGPYKNTQRADAEFAKGGNGTEASGFLWSSQTQIPDFYRNQRQTIASFEAQI